MKRSVGIIIVILILTLGVIIALAQEPAGAELRFVNQEPTYSITAFYDVLMDDVTDISVTFDAAVSGSAYANYIAEDHQLRISVASLEPINLWRPIGVAVASTSSDDAVTPALRLTYLKYNGVRSDSNMIPGSISGDLTDGYLTADITLRDDLMGSVSVVVAAYDGEGCCLATAVETLSFTSEIQTFPVALGNCPDAVTVKAFFITDTWRPYTEALEGFVE